MITSRLRSLVVPSMLAIVCLVASETCLAESTSLRAGGRALLFQASSDIHLSSFNGATISMKHHTSPGGAWRFGMTLALSTYDQDYDDQLEQPNPPSPTPLTLEEGRDEAALSIAVERLRYLTPEKRISLYYGLGPMLSGSWRKIESITPNISAQSSENTSYGVGLGAVLGVEWFPHDQIGILGQYGSSVSYNWKSSQFENQQSGSVRTTEIKSRELAFRADVVRLGISLYW